MISKEERAELRGLVEAHASAKGATEPYSMSPKWFADGPRVRIATPDVDPDAAEVGDFVRVRFAEYAVASINVARFAKPLLDALDAADRRVAELEARLEIGPSGEDKVDELTDAVSTLRARIAELEGTVGELEKRDDHLTLELASAFHNLATNIVEAIGHAVLQGRVLDDTKARIVALEDATQWRTMDTCPSGEWVFILMPSGRIADLKFHAVDGTDGCWQARNGGLMRGSTGDDFVAWLPIPALPEGGV